MKMTLKKNIILCLIIMTLSFILGFKLSIGRKDDYSELYKNLNDTKLKLETIQKRNIEMEKTIDALTNISSSLKIENDKLKTYNENIKTLSDKFSEGFNNLESSSNNLLDLISNLKDSQKLVRNYINEIQPYIK